MLRDATLGLQSHKKRYVREMIFSAPRSGVRAAVCATRFASRNAPRDNAPTMVLTASGFETTTASCFARRTDVGNFVRGIVIRLQVSHG